MSHINKLEFLQSKILRTIVNAMVCQKRGYTQRPKNSNGQKRNWQIRKKIQGKNDNTSNQLAAEASKTLLKRRLKRKQPTDLTKEIK